MQKILSFMQHRPLPSLLFFVCFIVIIIAIIILIKMKIDFIKLFLYFIESHLLFNKKPKEAEPHAAEVKKEGPSGPENKKEGPSGPGNNPENKTENYQFDEAAIDSTPNDARPYNASNSRVDNTSGDDAPNEPLSFSQQESDIKIDHTIAKEPKAAPPILDLKPFTPVPSDDADNLLDVYYSTTGDWIIQARGGAYVEVADEETQVLKALTAREYALYKRVNDDATLQNVNGSNLTEPITTTLDRLGYTEDEIKRISETTAMLDDSLAKKKEQNSGPAPAAAPAKGEFEGEVIYDELIKPVIDLGNTPPEQRVKAPSEQVD